MKLALRIPCAARLLARGLAAGLPVVALLAAGVSRAELAVGDPAPEFELQGSDGRTYSLEGVLAERGGLVLAWFPKAKTSGCTQELGSLRDSARDLAAFDVAYFMVSIDDPKDNAEFATEEHAGFVLLSDPDKKVAKRYGVLGAGGLFARRWTFFIDKEGIVRRIDKQVETATHGADVAAALAELGFPAAASRSGARPPDAGPAPPSHVR